MLSPPSLTTWVDSPDGTLWHPRAQIYGKDVRLILSTLVGSLLVWLAMTILSLLDSRRKESPVHAHHPTPPQIQPGWEGKCLESTELLDPKDTLGLQIRCFDASTGWHLATLEADTRQTIDDKLAAASEAAKKWEGSEWSARRRLLRSILAWIVEDQEKIVRVACRDTGKAAVDAYFGEILTTSSKLHYLIENAEKVLRPETRPNGNILLAHKRSRVHYKPLGVVAAMVSWNYPFTNILSPIVAALASGNAIVVKPSEHVAFSTTYYVQCLHRLLSAMELPTSLITLVLAHPPLAPYLTMHPRIKHITFIGSEATGRKVMIDAARNLTPVVLELGGKDPAVLLPDVYIASVAPILMRAVYQSAGQNCIGLERFIVHETRVAELVAAIEPRVRALRCGSWMEDTAQGRNDDKGEDPHHVDMGAMISSARFDELESLIKSAISQGAKLHCGGSRLRHPRWPAGAYFQPTLLSAVTPEMAIAQQEVFAPIFLIMPYAGKHHRQAVESAVRIANDGTGMGLGSSVFGQSEAPVRWVAERMEAGMVNLNDFAVSYLNQALPFGGVKRSGFGRFAGPEGLRGLCYAQAVVEDRLFKSVRTKIPGVVDYPMAPSRDAWAFVSGLHDMAFAPGVGQRARGLWSVVRGAIRGKPVRGGEEGENGVVAKKEK
ncbi:ALDH-like protein [Jaminaea rosea]|uniref:ALDH-like protein n=1 Tax=Jaminaea rosea TaxID=1569628 RepID=A0A316UIC2_9BASI|nr:ALDH-like protein [Jaminaea rosea]PWN25026.1 ALDH-like protein [Jaminaea rosea]